MTAPSPTEWICRKQAAEILQVSTRTVDRIIKDNKVRWKRQYNRRILIEASSVRRLLP
jgi:hypothetical protein